MFTSAWQTLKSEQDEHRSRVYGGVVNLGYSESAKHGAVHVSK